ncbi:anti-sigma regulatory factor (Ser/Thr protein kinase) [Pseudonocardia sediminis]|uniref:Anti-sigma regulatory factor (Ser/Thr protein kinase) n=1 Tax=Pseudonocardia sediminis TaxID=1397368 RepID=A0A4Q7V2Q5_PSEST|nr:ATP-binding protein [Pseudonocardia sediminis]RZT88852.1 anti-sigma regulatory factor (Ser/Thr protein kinase) [Pseudonocardia sediminis]
MTAVPAGTVHRAVPFADTGHQAEVLSAPLREALERGDRALAVVDPGCRAELDRTLGADAGVEFRTPEDMHSAPAFTVATRWARIAREATGRDGTRMTTVGQHIDTLPVTDPGYWTRLDVALDRVLDGLPVTMLCCFPDRPGARDVAATLHDALLVDGGEVPSTSRRDPRDLLAEHPQAPPADLGEPLFEMDVDLAALGTLRRTVHTEATLSGLGPSRTSDLVLALNEIATNGVEHGSGLPRLRLWRGPEGLTGEVADSGRTRLPFPGMLAPPPAGVRGRGLWLASELTDVLQVWTADDDPDCPAGTVVRVLMTPP